MARVIVGVAEHGNSAELVTIAAAAELLDRRRVDLTEPGLPSHPYHHQGSWAVGRYLDRPWAKPTTLPEAIALVERVEASARRCAKEVLSQLTAALPSPITGINLRECPKLPNTIEARIRDNRAQTVADTVMYRQALAEAATARGWTVHWYRSETIFKEAAKALGKKDIDAILKAMGKQIGPPWQARHKLAAAAAIVASR